MQQAVRDFQGKMPAIKMRKIETPAHFLHRKKDELHQNAFSVILRDSWKVFMILVAIPVVLTIRFLRPLVCIRLGPAANQRIGTYAGYTEIYLCMRAAGLIDRHTWDIFYNLPTVCNLQLKKMIERRITVWPFARWIEWVNSKLPGASAHVIPQYSYRDTLGLFQRFPAQLSFTRAEERKGRDALRKLGIEDGSPFVCVHTRDPAYLSQTFPDMDLNYHDFRDSSIEHCVPAMKQLAERGITVIRMGAAVSQPLTVTHPKIIDYATKSRTDFLDIFLGAKCRFFIGNTSGLYAIPDIFRKPIAYINCIPLEYVHTWCKGSLFIPKKLWLKKEQRFLTFPEILESGLGRMSRSEELIERGIDAIENSPEEIQILMDEMDERLRGTWKISSEDEELQRKFWSLFKKDHLNGVFFLRIGTQFLRQNIDLLGCR